jgi:hypothetical protein
MSSVLDRTVSCFKSYHDTSKPIDISLLNFINTRKYKQEIDLIRSISEKDERDKRKSQLPAITPSGTFTYRNENSLVKHSGLVQFDIDYKGNEHIDNFEDIVHEIGKLPYIAYCGFSASGYGVWGLVPIAYPEKHKLHLQALKNIFSYYDIKCDTAPSNVASLRGYSYDDNAYINHNAELFTQITKPQDIRVKRSNQYESTIEQRFERAIRKTQQCELFVDGAKHTFLVKLAGYCNAVGMDYDTVVNLVEINFRSMTDNDVDLEKPIANVYKGYKQQHGEYA